MWVTASKKPSAEAAATAAGIGAPPERAGEPARGARSGCTRLREFGSSGSEARMFVAWRSTFAKPSRLLKKMLLSIVSRFPTSPSVTAPSMSTA